jgi:flavin-dependent dehydrogenase
VCGGFLGWDAIAALKRLGLDPAALGARPIRRVRLTARRRTVEAPLPGAAAGLSRRRLDGALLRLAEESGAAVLRGRAARALEGDRIRLEDGETMAADALFLATGKHELRGAAREIGDRPASIGLRAAFAAPAGTAEALAGMIELHLFDQGYCGLLVQEDGRVNLGLSTAKARLAAAGGPDALIAALAEEAPLLARRIGDAPFDRWHTVAGVPYGWRAGADVPGRYRIGDQAAVIASLAGDGIAVALASAAAAAHACLHGDPDYQSAFARRARRPIAIAELLRHMAEHPARRQLMIGLAGLPGIARAAARLTRIDGPFAR